MKIKISLGPFDPSDPLSSLIPTKIWTLEVKESDKIKDVKKKLEEQEGIPADSKYVLIHNGKTLKDCTTLKKYGIKEDDVICLIMNLMARWS